MSKIFNLNINAYKHKELEDVFSLQFPYTKENVLMHGEKMKAQLLKDSCLKEDDKSKVVTFIETATKRLSQGLSNTVLNPRLKKSEIVYSGGHMIIKHADITPSTSWAGTINPLSLQVRASMVDDNSPTILKTLNIDSLFRKNYYNTKATDFHITLNTELKNVVQMRLAACELPQSIYAISTAFGNNFFRIEWVSPSGAGLLVPKFADITIPDGNYEGIAMQNALIEQLNQPILLVSPFGGTAGEIQATFDVKTGKIIIAANAAAGVTTMELFFNLVRNPGSGTTTIIDSTALQLKLGWILGYRFGAYSGNTAYVTEGIYDFRGPRYLYVVVNDFNNNYNETIIGNFTDSLTSPENILARVAWSQYAFFPVSGLAPLDTTKTARNYFGPVNINRLHIQVMDPFGRVLSLNNMDWTLVLEFSCLYKV